MVKFSIIIPVYNAEKTLERCLNSILKQRYEEYEVIMIDDGSKDSSFEICKRYERKDQRFKIYHQKNQGPSAARNRGLKFSKGNWICFVDSDDAVSDMYLEKLSQKINTSSSEVIFFGYKLMNELNKEEEIRVSKQSEKNYFECLISLSKKDMYGYTWIKCIKKECIGEIKFNEQLNLFEDEVFVCQVLKNCREVSVISEPLYCYYIGSEDALTKKVHFDYCNICETVFQAWKELLDPYENSEKILREKANYFMNRCIYYGLENPVNTTRFFKDLSKTEYFTLADKKGSLEKNILEKNYNLIFIKKQIYHLKMKLWKILKSNRS